MLKIQEQIKSNASLGSKINQKQTKKIQIKEKKLNFVLIQNGKVLVIFFCLQAKLQLFQEYRALLEKFFFFRQKVERLPKKLYDAANARKKPLFTLANRALKIKHCCKHGRYN